MKINLYISFYCDKNPDRQKELEFCLKNNMSSGFSDIWILAEEQDSNYLYSLISTFNSKAFIHIKVVDSRPTFNNFIDIANKYDNEWLHIVQNSDIYIDKEAFQLLGTLKWHNKLFLGLSRWDQTLQGNLIHLERKDSQDSFIWQGKTDVQINHSLGLPGSDNSILFKFFSNGYKVYNPSKTIKIKHLHNVKGNNYRVAGKGDVIASQIIPEPYYFADPCYIENIN